MKWKHHVVLSFKRGRVKAACQGHECGWQTRWLDDREEAGRLSREHTGLKEKENLNAAAR